MDQSWRGQTPLFAAFSCDMLILSVGLYRYMYIRRVQIVSQTVIIFYVGSEQHRHHYHVLPQQRASIRDERIVTYTEVSVRTQAS